MNKLIIILLLSTLIFTGCTKKQSIQPEVVYTGGKNINLSEQDILTITNILKSEENNIAYLEINKITENTYYVYPESEIDVIHSGEPYVFEKKGPKWILIRGPKLLKR